MRLFRLTAHITVSAATVVEAETLEEAIEIAKDRDAELEFLGSNTDETEVWAISDADGTPENIHQE